MSEERIEVERCEEQMTNTHGKRKKRIVSIIITAILLLIVSISLICVLKYQAEHRYIPFEELDEGQIIFVKEYRIKNTIGVAGYICLYSISGNEYKIRFQVEEYGQIEEICNAFLNGEVVENDNIQVEVQESYSGQSKIIEMYEKMLLVNEDEYKKVSYTFIMDSGVEEFYGVRYLENGEVECISLWKDGEGVGRILLDDPYAKEIREWLRTL